MIEEVSVELLVRNGYQGFRFKDVADALHTTRAAIHYHYGNKQTLADTVVVKYITQLLSDWERNWDRKAPFAVKIIGMMEANKSRYLTFNPTLTDSNPWSLIGRMRGDRDHIGPAAREALVGFGITLERFIIKAIDDAVANGEFEPTVPRRDVALQLVAIADSAGAITLDGGSFERLEMLYRSFARILEHAYGLKEQPAAR